MSERDQYHSDARSWAEDTRLAAARSRRTAWTVAGIAVAVAAFEALALAMLTPLKTVQPVTLLVDRQTGFVQALNPLEPRRVGADAALTQSLLAQYVAAREGFDRATVGVDYRKVALWSTGRARSTYLETMPATNPRSPFQANPAGINVIARVKSVSRLSPGTALVRFDTWREDRNGRAQMPQPWLSVVRYRFSDAPMQFEDRLVNPLGFQVSGYRRDAEAPPPPAAVSNLAPGIETSTNAVSPSAHIVTARASPVVLRAQPERTETVSRARTRQLAYRAPTGVLASREVPLNNIPLGSPLGPPVVIMSGTPASEAP